MVVLCRFILLKNLAALSNLPATCFTVTSLFKPNSSDGDCGEPQYVSKCFWANERTGAPQLLKLGQRNLQLQWKLSLRPHVPGEHMCKTNSTQKQSWCCKEQECPLTVIKRTKKKTSAWSKRVGFFLNREQKTALTYFGLDGCRMKLNFTQFPQSTLKKHINWYPKSAAHNRVKV